MMNVKLQRSPKKTHKWRVTFDDGKQVHFGAKGYSDYTLHGDPHRMRRYVKRHGGQVSDMNVFDVQRHMLRVRRSTKENWSAKGLRTPGFWSRWLLWSHPSLVKAKRFMAKTFNVRFI